MDPNVAAGKLGRLPAHPEATHPRLKLAPFLQVAQLPPTPAVVDWASKIRDWPMYGNDRWGCCLVEGTPVQADGVQRAYRVHYSGPVLRLQFESGRVVTVTPNHAVLTPRGFVRARFLKKGDYAVRASRPEMLDGGVNFNQTPAPIEEVFASLARSGTATRQCAQSWLSASPDYFHGDARFFDGDVDVVDALGFLEDKRNSSLSEPDSKGKILPAGQLERDLHGFRSALKGSRVGRTPSFGVIRGLGDLGPFGDGHGGVPHAERLPLRPDHPTRADEELTKPLPVHPGFDGEFDPSLSTVIAVKERHQIGSNIGVSPVEGRPDAVNPRRKLVANSTQPPLDGFPTDPELASDLLQWHPGLVQADCLIDVHEQRFHGYVYDLSTARRWYVADEIVVHNCVWSMIGHAIEVYTTYGTGHTITVTDRDILTAYSDVTGFNPNAGPPGDNPTDQGTVIQDALNYWRKTGVGGHKILAFAEVDVRSPAEVDAALAIFGQVFLGIDFPNSAMTQFNTRRPWDVVDNDGGIDGGHAIDLVYDEGARRLKIVTWGQVQEMTPAFWDRYVTECWTAVSPQWLDAAGRSPAGLDLYGLGQALTALTGEPNPFPTPPPTPPPAVDPDRAFADAFRQWAKHPRLFGSARLKAAGETWLKSKGL